MGAGTLPHPGRHPGRFRFPRRRAYSTSTPFVPSVAGVGANGAATFVLGLEPGAKVTLAWGTDVFKSYSGNEQRCNTTGPMPKQRFEGNAFLLDGPDRDTRSTLMRAAAAGSTYLLAIPYEALPLVADAVGTVVTVPSTTSCDWAQPGQRCILVGPDGTTQVAVVQSTTATTITLGAVDANGNLITVGTLGTAARAGGSIMPLVQVLLAPQQGFARYPVSADLWAIKAQANVFGWGGVDSMGKGAQITTYTYGIPIDQSLLLDNDLLVWDRPNDSGDTASDAMASLSELVDLGALPFGAGPAPVPDWVRPIKYSSSSRAEWQWVKAFLRLVLGRQRSFAVSTNRPDLVFVSASGPILKVQSASIAGGGDYTAWYTSLAHRRLALTKSDGSIQYVAVTAAPTNNGDGTLTLQLDSAVSGSVAMISLLEQLRFDNGDSDDFAVTWDGPTFSVELQARASQETIVPPRLFLYDTFIDFHNTAFGGGVEAELSLALGQATFVKYTSTNSPNWGGISVTTPGGAQDGMLVTICDEMNNTLGSRWLHEDTNAPAADRFWLVNRTALISGVAQIKTFVYSSAVQRWIQIW